MTEPTHDLYYFMGQPFEALPSEFRQTIYDVDYADFVLSSGGRIFLTRYGWRMIDAVLPASWYIDAQYENMGEILPGATGTVYRVPVRLDERPIHLVVKFSRVAQEVPLFYQDFIGSEIPRSAVEFASFNDPFEEFGLLQQLRERAFNPTAPLIRTKRPLAIYSPAEEFELWRLGRSRIKFTPHRFRLKEHQVQIGKRRPVDLDIRRDYIMLYHWVDGMDAEQFYQRGRLTQDDLIALTRRVADELKANGFWVLDNKPKHIILRENRETGRLLHRNGELVYVLIDFELLKRITHD
jgi:hypothetical protein